MSDKINGRVLRTFTDAGTTETFKEGTSQPFEAGAFGNYEAGGLVERVPDEKPVEEKPAEEKPAAKSGKSA